MQTPFPIHVRTLTGLEEILADELSALGAKKIEIKKRLVICSGDLNLLYKANLWCRTAIRVLVPIASFHATEEKHLYEGVRRISWSPWLSTTGTLSVDSHVHSSFSTHSLYISQLVKDAVVDQFRDKTGERPSVDLANPDLRIAVSLFEDFAQIYVDSSGESLHKRGYRQKAGDAPLSETLAAGMVKLSQWDRKSPLIDPMCGSGTLAIEAALLAKNIAPGILRNPFGFQKWSNYDRMLYTQLVQQAKKAIVSEGLPSIVGFDIDPIMVAVARENVRRAGVSDIVKIESGDFFKWNNIPPKGTLLINPPYDERLELRNVFQFYEDIGEQLKNSYAGWSAFLLSGNLEAVKAIRLRTSKRHILFNGSLESRLLKYEMRARQVSEPMAIPTARGRE